MRKLLIVTVFPLLLLLFLLPVAGLDFDYTAYQPGSLAEEYRFSEQALNDIIAQFMDTYNLSERNFSMSYYATDTGETAHVAEQTYRFAASTYKLALNMYYYDLERTGQLEPDALIGGGKLSDMHYASIVNSDNNLSMILMHNLGTFREYRELMTQYCDQEYPSEYYANNNINTYYMLSVLQHLYENESDYEELISLMKKAAAGRYLQCASVSWEIAHKFGYYDTAYDENGAVATEEVTTVETDADGNEIVTVTEVPSTAPRHIYINDVGIVYTPSPFLLAVYTDNVSNAERVIGNLCELLSEYSVWQTVNRLTAEAEEAAAREAEEAAAQRAKEEAEKAAALAAKEAAEQAEQAASVQQADSHSTPFSITEITTEEPVSEGSPASVSTADNKKTEHSETPWFVLAAALFVMIAAGTFLIFSLHRNGFHLFSKSTKGKPHK